MTKDLLLGRVIDGKYRIDAEIGSGGMATIYRATRLQIDDVVAIKVLHTELLREPKFAERFQREAQAAARLKHPNVVAIYDFGVSSDSIVYIVMELVEGRNLRAVIREDGPMTVSAAAVIVRQVCAALTEAHRQHVIHRDIKPANIAVEESSHGTRVRVLDFGIANLGGSTMMTFTQTGTVMGTPAYMSPEQCMGEDLDGRSDIYSLGVVLFEMLSGVAPFNSPTATAVIMQHVQQTPPPLRVLNVSVSAAVEAVVLRALAKRREDRQQSARQLAQEFDAAVAGLTGTLNSDDRADSRTQPFSPSHSALTMVQSAVRRPDPIRPAAPAQRSRMIGIIIGLMTAAVIGVIWFGLQRALPTRQPSTPVAAKPSLPHRTARQAAVSSTHRTALTRSVPPAYENPVYTNSVAFVNEYYRLWNNGQYGAMYSMLSVTMQRKNPYDQYIKYHSLVTRISVDATPGYAPDVVNVHIISDDREKDGSITENVNDGRWFLTTERSQLRLDDQVARATQVPTVVAAPATPSFDPALSVNFVQEYYRLWNVRDYTTMYGMLSTYMQEKHPYGDYVKYHSMVVRIEAEVTPTYSPLVVNVHIVSLDREKNGSMTENINEGQWYLTSENGVLKLDDQKVHDVH